MSKDLEMCRCGDRAAVWCPGKWEKGCDLGNNEDHTVPAKQSDVDAFERWKGGLYREST
jgi:hypothetical protein